MSDILKNFQKKVGAKPDGIFGFETMLAGTKYYKFSAERGAHFFGQLSIETGDFKCFEEILNYSVARLRKIFPKYFPNDDIASEYANNPEKLANYVYGKRIGKKKQIFFFIRFFIVVRKRRRKYRRWFQI